MKVKNAIIKNIINKKIVIINIEDKENKHLINGVGVVTYPFVSLLIPSLEEYYKGMIGIYLNSGNICNLYGEDEIEILK